MKKRSWFYSLLMISWIFFGIFLSRRLFGDDSLAEISTVICFCSISLFISYGIEFFINKLGIAGNLKSDI